MTTPVELVDKTATGPLARLLSSHTLTSDAGDVAVQVADSSAIRHLGRLV